MSQLTLKLNAPYVFGVLTVGFSALGFIVWSVTAQALSAYGAGNPLPGGFTRLSVLLVDLLAAVGMLGLASLVYRSAHTAVSSDCISQSSLFGRTEIAWRDLDRVQFVGYGIHFIGAENRIVFTPYAYYEPKRVAEKVLALASEGKGDPAVADSHLRAFRNMRPNYVFKRTAGTGHGVS